MAVASLVVVWYDFNNVIYARISLNFVTEVELLETNPEYTHISLDDG